MKFNRKYFYQNFRKLFNRTKLSQEFVDATEFLLDKLENEDLTIPQMAYILATVYHETAGTMKPIKEYGSIRYLKSKAYYPFYGRGYVQLTWKQNYIKFTEILREVYNIDVDLVKDPDKALDPEISYYILVYGMQNGVFTGKKLSHYINEDSIDYYNARKIVNGLDRAGLIQQYALKFEDLLKPVEDEG